MSICQNVTKRIVRWRACWIWHPSTLDVPNTYLLARKTFTLPQRKPQTAWLHMTAAHHYHLYVNGQFVDRGPDRCYFREPYYHSIDVAKYLRPGRNLIAVRCHYYGRNLSGCIQRHGEGPSGLLAQLDGDGFPIIWTNASWRVHLDPAFKNTNHRISFHRGWREDYHPQHEIPEWRSLAGSDDSWEQATEIAPAQGGPWRRLVPKTTPPLEMTLVPPRDLFVTNYGGQDCGEYNQSPFSMLGKGYSRRPGPFKIWNNCNRIQELLFDLGEVMAGYPVLQLAGGQGATVDVYYGENLHLAHMDTLHPDGRPFTWSPFNQRGARYFRLNITNAKKPLEIRSVRWLRMRYPVVKRGSFVCSDDRLNRIWDLCVRTARTCALEHFTDCVTREQVLWMTDFRFQVLQHFHYFGDTELAKKCFRQFALLQLPNGHILGYGPSSSPLENLLKSREGMRSPRDFMGANFYFVLAVWEFYQLTGDRQFLKEYYPLCSRVLKYYERAEVNGFCQTGKIPGSPFVDWYYEGSGEGLNGFLQTFYYAVINTQSQAARILGHQAQARRLKTKAARLERRFLKYFTNPRTGLTAERLHHKKRFIIPNVHPHAGLLRFLDHIPPRVRLAALDLIIKRRVPSSKTGFFNQHIVEALFRQGHPSAGLKLLRDYWGAIVDSGLPQVPEAFDMEDVKGSLPHWAIAYSFCHSYASGAGSILQQHILGATVTGKTVTITPYFGDLQFARGTVPTIAGDVRISWQRETGGICFRIQAPKSITLTTDFSGTNEKVRSIRTF